MAKGDRLPSEQRSFRDPVSGAELRQLTSYRAHSHHLYFTNSGLWDGGRRLLIASHRANAANLFSIELDGGEMTQITDFPPQAGPQLQRTFINPTRDEAYLTCDGELLAVDLRTLEQRGLYRVADGFVAGNMSCTADGRTVCLAEREDLSRRIRTDLGHGYTGFVETFEARPRCRIVAVASEGGETRVIHEDTCWIGHVNTSPVLPEILTFCHEGPWHRVQRMWLLNIRSGEVQPLRKQTPPEAIGHEYWFADGRRVGYHGWKDPTTHLFGFVRWDGSEGREWPWRGRSMHFHSLDEGLVVGDGGKDLPYVLLWRLRDDRYDGPKVLAWHRGSFHSQILHVHPRMFSDSEGRRQIAFTADPQSYGNVYLAELADFDALPDLERTRK
jgi:oligogalacturonide lyase